MLIILSMNKMVLKFFQIVYLPMYKSVLYLWLFLSVTRPKQTRASWRYKAITQELKARLRKWHKWKEKKVWKAACKGKRSSDFITCTCIVEKLLIFWAGEGTLSLWLFKILTVKSNTSVRIRLLFSSCQLLLETSC